MLDGGHDLGVIERRIQAVAAVRQLVHAVWALARAQLPFVEQAAAEATEYLDWVDRVVDRLAGKPIPLPTDRTLHVVLGPERAYCGALPRRVVEQLPEGGLIGLVGQRVVEQANADPRIARRVVFRLPGAASHDETESVANVVARAVLEHAGTARVELLHPHRGGAELHRSVLLAGPRSPLEEAPETFSAPARVIDAAIEEAVTGRLAVGLAEVLRSEVRARAAAAEQARSAADGKLVSLRQQWRVARQEQITSELLEVVAGRQALLARTR